MTSFLFSKVPIGCESHLWAYAFDRVPGCGVENTADLQAHIIAALLAFRLTLTPFLSSLLLPCLFADSSLSLAFPRKVGFHFIGFSEDAVHVIRCNFQTPGFFSQGSVCLFPLRDFFGQFFFPFFQGFQRWQLSIVFFPEIFHGFCIRI